MSTAAISSGVTSPHERPLPPLALKISRPFNLAATPDMPRTWMPFPSVEKWSASMNREMETPDTRCSTSVMLLSGSMPASSATTESTMDSAFFFRSVAF